MDYYRSAAYLLKILEDLRESGENLEGLTVTLGGCTCSKLWGGVAEISGGRLDVISIDHDLVEAP